MKTNNLFKSSLILLATASIGLVSCKKDKDPVPAPVAPNENEVITTFTLVMLDDANPRSMPLEFTWRDMDGDGPAAATIPTIILEPNKIYSAGLLILDETKKPADTTSYEIEEESDDHQFFYKPMGGVNLTVDYDDEDKNKVPVGLLTKFITGAASIGTINIILKHQPGVKPKSGKGDESKGSVDITLTLPVKIQAKAIVIK